MDDGSAAHRQIRQIPRMEYDIWPVLIPKAQGGRTGGKNDFLQISKICGIFAAGTEIWCNGSTTDFGSVCRGSNPLISTRSL